MRPRGRWFIGLLVLTLVCLTATTVWTTFFKNAAHGVVKGVHVLVSPPWDGVVREMHVREGDHVREGQLLVTMDDLSLRHSILKLDDEMRMAQATLVSEVARLKWQLATILDQDRGSLATYYETLGQLLNAKSKLSDLKTQLRRATPLEKSKALSKQDFDNVHYSVEGQEKLVKELDTAVKIILKRSEYVAALLSKDGNYTKGYQESGFDQLRPLHERLDVLRAERQRLTEKLDSGAIKSPASGIVASRHRFTGEFCKREDPVVSILAEGSTKIILYVRQESSERFKQGDDVEVVVAPISTRLRCKIVRIGDFYLKAPDPLERHYWWKEELLPIHMKPVTSPGEWLRDGAIVELRHDWIRTLKTDWSTQLARLTE